MDELVHVSEGDPHPAAHNQERDLLNELIEELAKRIPFPPGAAVGDLLRWDGSDWLTTETRFFEGEGNPNGQFAGPVGSRYVDKTAQLGIVEWVKAFGGETNQGWVSSVGDTGWKVIGAEGQPGFLNSWNNYPGAAWTKGAFRRINGIVYLRGLLTKTGARNNVIFNLPPGFRPSGDTHIVTTTGAASSIDTQGINVYADGRVIGRATNATGGFLSLDGVSYPADN